MHIEERGKSLLLRWSYEGKSYSFSLKDHNNPIGKSAAKMKLAAIEKDIRAGYFDTTLLKYKPRKTGSNPTEITAVALFEQYAAAMIKGKDLAPGSKHRYKAIASKLRECLGGRPISKIKTLHG